MIPRLPPRDPTVVLKLMVRKRVRPTPCIESLPDKGGQTVGPVEHSNSEPMVRLRVRPAPCIESLPDKGGQMAGPVEHNNG
ncbi:hypothetical protein A2U01_0041172, partial [Trifolium medium]|nr:hypothetical protein [Trifolium medium]